MPTYSNGSIPFSAMVEVEPGLYLTPLAANSYRRVKARLGCSLTDAFRSYSEQVRIFLERYQVQLLGSGYYGDVRYWRGKRYVRKFGYAAAAVPGTSNHGNATAIDVRNIGSYGSATFNRYASVLIDEGWSNAEGRSVNEPWHWTKNSTSFVNQPNQSLPPVVVVPPPAPAPTPIDPVTNLLLELEDDMRLARKTSTGEIRLIGVATSFKLETVAEANVMQGLIGKSPTELTDDEWNLLDRVINRSIINTAGNLRTF